MDAKEKDLKKLEEAALRDSGEIVELSKRHFWNNLIIIGFTLYSILYAITVQHPRKEIVWVSMIAVLIASGERFYLQSKIKKRVVRLTTFSMIIEFIKKAKNESTCNR